MLELSFFLLELTSAVIYSIFFAFVHLIIVLNHLNLNLGDVPSLTCDASDSHMTVNACILMQPVVQ